MEVAERQTMLLPGDEIGCYRIENFLGKGGFGVTYLALDTMLDMQVAIKEYMPEQIATRVSGNSVHPKTSNDADVFSWGLSRFIKEAQTLARFNHPNIVRVMAVFEQNGTAYMVMEYERGKDLKLQLRDDEYRTQKSLESIIGSIIDGLDEVHRHGYIHRDIKPANILIRDNGTPVLLDFGSARLAIGSQTQNLTALVSVGYAPLEQYNSANDNQQGPWTDIYALGAVLYYAITGNAPVDSTLRGSAVLNDKPDPLLVLAQAAPDGFSKSFCAAIDWALKFKVADRPQTLSVWRERLLSDDATILMPGNSLQNKRTLADTRLPPPIVNTSQPRHFSRTTTPIASPMVQSDVIQASASGNVSPRMPSRIEAANGSKGAAYTAVETDDWDTSSIYDQGAEHVSQAALKKVGSTAQRSGSGKRLIYMSCLLLSVAIGAAVVFYYSLGSPDPIAAQQIVDQADIVKQRQLQEESLAAQKRQQLLMQEQELARQASVERANEIERVSALERANEIERVSALERANEIERASALERANTLKREAEFKRQADIELRRLAQESELAMQVELARVKQLDQQQQEALEAQRIAEITRQGSIAREQESLKLAVVAAEKLASEPQIDSSLPITDNDMAAVLDRFNSLMRVIENKNKQALRSMTGESVRKYAYFDYLFESFEKIEISITNIQASRLDQTIRGTLEIRRMRRSNGDIAFPPPEFQAIAISSIKYGEWSQIKW